MKIICAHILLCLGCLSAAGQAELEYLPIDSVRFDWGEKDCVRYNKRIVAKCNKLAARVKKTTDVSLQKFMSLEDALLQKMCNINERQAESLIKNSLYSYRRLEGMQQRDSNQPLATYMPELDSVAISLNYIDSEGKGCGAQAAQAAIQNLKAELKRSELVGQYIKERNVYLRKLSTENPALTGMLMPLEKAEYYFNTQVNEYFKLFQLRSHPEKAVMALLRKAHGFQDYSNMNGMLAQMNTQSAAGSGQSMAAVKAEIIEVARAQGKDINDLLNPENLFRRTEKPSKAGVIPTEMKEAENGLKGEITSSNDDLLQLDKPEDLKNASHSNHEIGKTKQRDNNDWTPNPLKTKRFVDRLVFGCNLQPGPRTTLFPASGTLSAQVSYQLTTKMNLGFGVSHIVGFYTAESGEGIANQIRLGTNGYNLRSYYDFEIFRNLFLQTNYEWNNRKSSIGERLQPLFPLNNSNVSESWLVGIKLKKPATKRTRQTIEILYDFMHNRTGQPALVVRMGMEFLPRNGYMK